MEGACGTEPLACGMGFSLQVEVSTRRGMLGPQAGVQDLDPGSLFSVCVRQVPARPVPVETLGPESLSCPGRRHITRAVPARRSGTRARDV